MESRKQCIDDVLEKIVDFGLSFLSRCSYSILKGVKEEIDLIDVIVFLCHNLIFELGENLNIFIALSTLQI